jgi:hypothetical protein
MPIPENRSEPSAARRTARRPARVNALLNTPLGSLIAWPWFDRVALWGLARWFLPLSRAWAAATVAGGDLDRFMAEVPLPRLPAGSIQLTRRALVRIDRLQADYAVAHAAWERAFFGAEDPGPEGLAEADARRAHASQALMMGRSALMNLPMLGAVPRIRYAIPDRAEVEARFGIRADRPEHAYEMPDPAPAIARSRALVTPQATEYWLRFASPHAPLAGLGGATVWAHVYEPHGVESPPSLVYGHGLGVEIEMLEGASEETVTLLREGARVVRIEAPWHNRRRPAGRYGGELFLATQPLGGLDLFAAQVREMGQLIAWCRANGSRRVGVGGTGLGALASQLVASHAHCWPREMRPDALMLLTTSDDVGGLAFHSSLAHATGLNGALADAGWTAQDIDRWRPLTDPLPAQPLPPEDIVILLGRVDDVTPFPQGLALAERWKVPPENLFLRHQGHFSAAVGLARDPAPLRRLAVRLKG